MPVWTIPIAIEGDKSFAELQTRKRSDFALEALNSRLGQVSDVLSLEAGETIISLFSAWVLLLGNSFARDLQ